MGTSTSKLTKILASKADAKAAIIEMGVSCDNELDKYGDRIREIRTPIPPPDTTSLIRPTSTNISDGSGDYYGNFSSNSVIGNGQSFLNWTYLMKSTYGQGTKVFYNGEHVKTIEEGNSFGNDASKKGLFLRLPYVTGARTLGLQANDDSSVKVYLNFPAPSNFTVGANTKIEFYLVDVRINDTTSPSFWTGGIANAYCRYTNEDIV